MGDAGPKLSGRANETKYVYFGTKETEWGHDCNI